MHPLNKRHMMMLLSLSLTAYAFAMAGCGEKKSPDQATKSADVTTTQSLVGTWASDVQNPRQGQQNINFLTITQKNIKLRVLCLIEAKDKSPAVNPVAEASNAFTIEGKNIKFAATEAHESAEAPKDCAASLAIGNIRFSIEADKLTLGLKADGSTETDAKGAGIVFKKMTSEQIQAREKEMIAKSAVALTTPAAVPGATDPAKLDQGKKPEVAPLQSLAGTWVLQSEDAKVKAKLGTKLSKVNFDYIRFSDKQNKFIERYACRYQILPVDKLMPPIEIGFKMNRLHLADSTEDILKATTNFDADGILFEPSIGEANIKIKEAIGTKIAEALSPEKIKLSAEEVALSKCQISYAMDQKIGFEISKDGKTLVLTDDVKAENSNGRREFHKFDEKNTEDLEIAKIIMRNTKEDKAPASPAVVISDKSAPATGDKATPLKSEPKKSDADSDDEDEDAAPGAPAPGKVAAPAAAPAPAALPAAPAASTAKPAAAPAVVVAPSSAPASAASSPGTAAPAAAAALGLISPDQIKAALAKAPVVVERAGK